MTPGNSATDLSVSAIAVGVAVGGIGVDVVAGTTDGVAFPPPHAAAINTTAKATLNNVMIFFLNLDPLSHLCSISSMILGLQPNKLDVGSPPFGPTRSGGFTLPICIVFGVKGTLGWEEKWGDIGESLNQNQSTWPSKRGEA